MKAVLVIALFAVVAAAHPHHDHEGDEALKELFEKATKDCAEAHNFSEESIKKLHAHDYSDSENLPCFQKCFFEKSGILNLKEHKFDEERIHAIQRVFKKEKTDLKEKLEKCSPLYKPDAYTCESAHEIFKCFH